MGTAVKIALISHCISNIIVTLVIFSLWRQNKSRFNGISSWMFSFLLQAVGMPLIFMRGIIPDFFSIVLSNTLIVAGSVILYFGFGDFINEKILRWPYLTAVGVFFIFYTYFGVISPNLYMRLTLIYFYVAIINFQCVRILWKNKDSNMAINYELTGGIIFFSGLFYLGSMFDNLYNHYDIDFFSKGLRFVTLIIVSQLIKIIVTFSIMIMVNRRLLLTLEDESVAKENLMKELEYQARVDILTNIWNRRTLEKRLEEELMRAKKYRGKMSLILLDIDYFKKVNDTFGHPVGDSVLKKIVEILKDNLRKTDFIGRWGGEEFIVVCAETDEKTVWKVAEKLRKAVDNYDFKLDIPLTISLGTATFDNIESLDEILKRADINMYKAKRKGRNITHPDICNKIDKENPVDSLEILNSTI
ncbi:GGDEF domain-containing protein [uncultured Ilyobacter sp.]|uniref:GGDEF domain-containing protein n=1 Tax=uncultured Ilyobacter sp. TaxID=544433 RepID=UPI002AA841AF|nr:GGDEF domain-containing protein [uncultured Ilyobacter sp.]